MPVNILMPALSPTMEEGKLAKWLVKEGDRVKSGDVIAEIETDKATMEVEAVDEGVVGRILVGEGTEGVKVNRPIAVLLAEGEGREALGASGNGGHAPAAPRETTPTPPSAPSPPAPQGAQGQPAPAPQAARAAAPMGGGVVVQGTRGAPEPAVKSNGAGRLAASPLARRLAREKGIDLARLKGSGPHGRVVKRDIEAALKQGPLTLAEEARAAAGPPRTPETAAAVEAAPASHGEVMPPPAAPVAPAAVPALSDEQILAIYEKGSYELVPHDNMRKVIARRLTQAKSTIPHFYLTTDCDLDALLAARMRINALSPKEGPGAFKISVNDMIIKALAMALQKVPAANATWTERGILRHRSSDIGVAVAIPNGLFTPVMRHAEVKSLSEISNEMKGLAARARARRLAPHEYQGGTTAISNLGMYGVKSFDAVINPPHATILAVGAGEKRPVVRNDQMAIATVMSCTLSCDHRVVDGALGAELLAAFKGFVEEPVTMLV